MDVDRLANPPHPMPTKMKSPTPGLRRFFKRAAVACAAFVAAASAHATPYASGLTNTGSQIIFRLNEAADSVKVIWWSDAVAKLWGRFATWRVGLILRFARGRW